VERDPEPGRGRLVRNGSRLEPHLRQAPGSGEEQADKVWFMHSGARGAGNRIGSYFIELAKKDMERHIRNLPDANLAY
jgi:RNA-splicing ligase RtcB